MELRGFIFDLDVLVANTLPVSFEAFRNLFRAETGREHSDADIRARFGPTEEGIIRSLAPMRYAEAWRGFLADYERAHVQCPAAFEGLPDVLRVLQGNRSRLGMVTGKGPATTAISLRMLGLEQFFENVETGSEERAIKPACIARILERWSLPGATVAYIGDSPYDVRSAREAGVMAIGAAWAPSTDPAELRDAEPDRLFTTIASFGVWASSFRRE